MPDNDNAGQSAGQQTQTGPGGQAPVANEDAEAQQLLADAIQQDASDEDESVLDAKGTALLSKYRSEAANLRKRMKELESAATKLKTLEDKDKTESQRLADQVAELQTQLAEHKVREVRAQAAAAVGLPAAMAQFITAADENEAKAQAKQLLEWGRTAGGVTDFRQGARTPAPQKMTGDDFIRRMAGRQ